MKSAARFVDPAADNVNAEGFVPLDRRSLTEQVRFMIHAVRLGRKPHRAVLDRKFAPPPDALPRWWDGSAGFTPPKG